MQNKKYRVEYNGHFLGHFYGKNETEAIENAVSRNPEYSNQLNDAPFSFTATKDRK